MQRPAGGESEQFAAFAVVVTRKIDTGLFTPDGTLPVSELAPVVFFVGRLIGLEGTAYLLRVMHEVRKQVPGAELSIAGSGPLRGAL